MENKHKERYRSKHNGSPESLKWLAVMLIFKHSVFWDFCKGIRGPQLCLVSLDKEEYENYFAKIFAFEEKNEVMNW